MDSKLWYLASAAFILGLAAVMGLVFGIAGLLIYLLILADG
jgi:hypothetical protein